MRVERRRLLRMMAISLLPLAGCTADRQASSSRLDRSAGAGSLFDVDYSAPILTEPYFVPGIRKGSLPEKYQRRLVPYAGSEKPGTIVVRTDQYFLYLIQPGGQAIRYGIGIGRDGFGWKGRASIGAKRKWPDWRPPKEMIARDPRLKIFTDASLSGGANNPIGARGLYLYQDGRDTLYRIHGAPDADSIGSAVTSGCIRMLNVDVIDLYERVPIGAQVVVI